MLSTVNCQLLALLPHLLHHRLQQLLRMRQFLHDHPQIHRRHRRIPLARAIHPVLPHQCRSNLFQQIPSRILSPCSRQMLRPSFGPNSWNGTSTSAFVIRSSDTASLPRSFPNICSYFSNSSWCSSNAFIAAFLPPRPLLGRTTSGTALRRQTLPYPHART